MSFHTRTLHDVMEAWDSDAEALRQWGHERQATILTQCRTVLEQLIEEEGCVSIGTVLTVWRSDAKVLDRYGHPDEATALLHCTDTLRKVVNGAASADREPTESPSHREVYVSKNYRRERTGGDGSGGSAGGADVESPGDWWRPEEGTTRAPAPRTGRPESSRRTPDREERPSRRR